MAFNNFSRSKPTPRRVKADPVFAVGWHAYVNWPQLAGQRPQPVPLIDGNGRFLINDLTDGQEVEIMSWRPRAREGVTYQIRRLSDGSEWWIAAVYLRRLREAQAGAEVAARR
jgi:hypothetical protein